jgi:hypothetical protein
VNAARGAATRAAILELANEGLVRGEIAGRLGLSYGYVKQVLQRAARSVQIASEPAYDPEAAGQGQRRERVHCQARGGMIKLCEETR